MSPSIVPDKMRSAPDIDKDTLRESRQSIGPAGAGEYPIRMVRCANEGRCCAHNMNGVTRLRFKVTPRQNDAVMVPQIGGKI